VENWGLSIAENSHTGVIVKNYTFRDESWAVYICKIMMNKNECGTNAIESCEGQYHFPQWQQAVRLAISTVSFHFTLDP
jgi:hypothetical protein